MQEQETQYEQLAQDEQAVKNKLAVQDEQATQDKEFNVDEALNRLEEINRKLAEQDLSLNDSIELYKEGTLLAAKCREHLIGVEKTLQIINE